MKEILFIRLSASGNAASWSLHGQQAGFSGIQRGNLEDVLKFCADRRVILMVSATEVMLTAADMPARLATGQSAKIQRAVPYILEEKLAEDVETLHFAIGRRMPNGQIPVAIVSREKMDAWVAAFRAQNITLAAIVADTQCLPLSAEGKTTWSVLLEDGRATVRSGVYAGFVCETEMLADYLALADKPSELQVYPVGAPESPASAEALPGVSVPTQFARPVTDGLEYLMRGMDDASAINLLQGDYASQADYQRWLQPWRAALVLLGVWLVLGLLSHGIEYVRLKHEFGTLQQDAETAFRAAFPQITRIVDVRTQAQQQLAILHKSGGNVGFLGLMQGTGAVLSRNPALKLQEIQFREGALMLALEAGDIAALDAFQQSFASQPGLSFEVQSANAGNQGVQIRVRVKARS